MRGSVVQKPKGSGRWYVVLELDRDPGNGARRRKWHSGFASKRDADRGLARLLASRDEGRYVSPRRLTFGAYLTDRWLPAIESTVRPTTFHGYRSHVRLYLLPALGAEQLQRVTPDQLSRFYRDLLASGGKDARALSPNTVRRVHATAHRALRDAARWGYLQRNPATAAVKPRQPAIGAKEIATWSADEMRLFLASVADDRLFAMWRLAATTGMRRGEIVGLRWVDVSMADQRLAVRQTVTGIGARVGFGEPKTRRGKRSVALDRDTVRGLAEWRRVQELERAAWGQAWKDTGLVFTREDGALIHPDLVTLWFRVHVRRAGVRLIRLHDLRHTHASLALQAGIPAKVVSERLGHATVSFTLDVYSHVVPGLQEDAAERIASLLQ
jgi:integrase